MKFLIATPTYDGTVTSEYMLSVRETERMLNTRGIKSDVVIRAGTNLPALRNLFSSLFYNRDEYSHILFVDADMHFSKRVVDRMINFDVEFCGCIYPRREIDLNELWRVGQTIANSSIAQSVAMTYAGIEGCGEIDSNGQRIYVIKEGFVRTISVGFGVTLIKRSVIQRMIERCQDVTHTEIATPFYQALGPGSKVVNCFDHARGPNGHMLEEDLSFCYRWTTKCGGEIWGLIDESIGHVGRFEFRGRPVDRLRNAV